jgi:hypothetical protein
MGRLIEPARVKGGVPLVRRCAYSDAQTFKRGAILIKDAATGKVKEAATAPVSAIVGVSLQAVDTGPGYGVPDSSSVLVTTGRTQETSVAIADAETVFASRMENGATDPVTPAQTDVFVNYGLKKQASGEWVVDQTNTATPAVEIIDFDADKKEVFLRHLSNSRSI